MDQLIVDAFQGLYDKAGDRWTGAHGEVGLTKTNPDNGATAEVFHAEGQIGPLGAAARVNLVDVKIPITHDMIGNEDLTVGLTGPGAAASFSPIKKGLPYYGGHVAGGSIDIGNTAGGSVFIGLYTPSVTWESGRVTLRAGPVEVHVGLPHIW